MSRPRGCLFRLWLALLTLAGSASLCYAMLVLWQPATEAELVLALFVFVTFAISLPSFVVYRVMAKKRLEANRAALLRSAMICPVCGYNCRKTPERCPECGTVLATAAS